ncbi:MAG: glycoside hydrolase family 9 protein [Candidatus Neomarinimicrobiota bacterium]|jgi:peptidoglycan/xylan/chitin deacetylase (PgdA/CDA1 family)|nr:glycoside hydrolase family 9 protein [bacterium]
MKRMIFIPLLFLFFAVSCKLGEEAAPDSWIRINQLGYKPGSSKTVVFCTLNEDTRPEFFRVIDAVTHALVLESDAIDSCGPYGPFAGTYRFDLNAFNTPGKYYIRSENVESPAFRIADNIYDGTADFLLRYMRQQRCNFNPYLNDSCHTNDGFIVYEPGKEGERINVTGGWHDATDYLQYTATSANAVFQMLLAYREYPASFRDAYDAAGLPGANGIPDVIDEAKWGMDWLSRMNPSPDRFFNQIADDRDHSGFRLPTEDSVRYHPEWEGRPVYFCTGEIQGLMNHKNRTSGVASTAGKFASAFAIGAQVLPEFYPRYAEALELRAQLAYAYGKQYPGACQTAPCVAPYFYEEDNWADDMMLAAAELYRLNGKKYFRTEVMKFAEMEPVSPWMGADTARHYQWYPFFNAGHYEAASVETFEEREKLIALYGEGLERIRLRGAGNAFRNGIPFIWCSNNFVTAALSQSLLYRKLSNDARFDEMEAALRDWLFGCNPWGSSMIVGLPANGDTPIDPHSSLTYLYDMKIDGGLVDGPVYGSIFNNLQGLRLLNEDEYADFQSDLVVYHDDAGDYSTNEPTMDGTACLVLYLASLESPKNNAFALSDAYGAVVRGNPQEKRIALLFSAHDKAEGGMFIADSLKALDVRASFFFTGDFYRNPLFKSLIKRLIGDGHYLGAHSDKHLPYNEWDSKRTLKVSEETFKEDLRANYAAMENWDIHKESARYFLAPYEWYDKNIALWTYHEGLKLINFTPGTLTQADYTTPGMGSKYYDNAAIYQSVMFFEDRNTLNGFIMLIHPGTETERDEKFYHELPRLIRELKAKGYSFVRIDSMLDLPHEKPF